MKLSKAAEKIADETGTDMETAETMARQLQNMHPDLMNAVEAWYQGNEMQFETHGVSLSMIREKEHCTHVQALLRMNLLLNRPQLLPGYPSWVPGNKDRGR